ncbi:MAG: hypothetical protein ACE5GW_05895 [Planctomycetota bacterium]
MRHRVARARELILLAMLAASSACVPGCNGRGEGVDAVTAFAERLRAEIGADSDPWTLAHGLLGLGAGLEVEGERASVLLIRRWLGEDPRRGPSFELKGDGGRLGEQHPHLVLKTFAELGIEPALSERLARAATGSFDPPRDFEGWNDSAWLLDATAHLEAWGRDRALGGTSAATGDSARAAMTVGELALGVLARVEEGDRRVEEALDLGGEEGFTRPSGTGEPAESGIYAYTCGGQHLLGAVIAAAGAGFYGDDALPRVRARVEVLIGRLEGEFRFRAREEERAIAAGISPIRARREGAQALLKLLGHGLENLARAHAAGLGDRARLTEAMERQRARLEEVFRAYLEELDPEGTIFPSLREGEPERWQRWFGDGCHALRGWSLSEEILRRSGGR